MSWYVVDVESDGPMPFKHSMVCFGAVLVARHAELSFYAETKPISKEWVPEALAVSGFTRAQHVAFGEPDVAMGKSHLAAGRPIYYCEDRYPDAMVRKWPADGRRELVQVDSPGIATVIGTWVSNDDRQHSINRHGF